jgi:hypothetical protein
MASIRAKHILRFVQLYKCSVTELFASSVIICASSFCLPIRLP